MPDGQAVAADRDAWRPLPGRARCTSRRAPAGASATSGPISVAASAGSPTVQAADHRRRPRRRPRRSGSRLARMRVCATHAWPLFMSDAIFRPSTVAARSASSRMIAADLPPSSRLTRLSCSPQIDGDAPAGRGRTGERDLVDAGVAHEVLADLTAGGQDRHDALRDAGLVEQLGHQVRVERRLGRGLDDDRAAGEQRGRELRHRDELRHVPRARCRRRRRPARERTITSVPSMPVRVSSHGYCGGDADERVEHHPRRGRLAEVGERDRRAHLLGDDRRHVAEAAPCRRRRSAAPRRCAPRATAAASRRRRRRRGRPRRHGRRRRSMPRGPGRRPLRCGARSPR